MPASWQNGFPENQQARNPASQHAVKLALDSSLTNTSIIYRGINKKTVNEQSIGDHSFTAFDWISKVY
jgi:hypothetical protein